jgi:hypothetical protein
MEDEGLQTHLWVGNHSRQIEIEGKLIVLYRCPGCSCNFCRKADEASWKAAIVSPLRSEFLHDSVSQQWVSERCPAPAPANPLHSAGPAAPEVQGISKPAPRRHRVNRELGKSVGR